MIDNLMPELYQHCLIATVEEIKKIQLSDASSAKAMSNMALKFDDLSVECIKAYVGFLAAQMNSQTPSAIYREFLASSNALSNTNRSDRLSLEPVMQIALNNRPKGSMSYLDYFLCAGLYRVNVDESFLEQFYDKEIDEEGFVMVYANYLILMGNPKGVDLYDQALYRFESDVNKLSEVINRIIDLIDWGRLPNRQLEKLIQILSRYKNDMRQTDGVYGAGTGSPIFLGIQLILKRYNDGEIKTQ